jgi:hypothetical protein
MALRELWITVAGRRRQATAEDVRGPAGPAGATGPRGDTGPAGADGAGLTPGAVSNSHVNASAAIAESKLNLATDADANVGSRRTLGSGARQAAAGATALGYVAYAGSLGAARPDAGCVFWLGFPSAPTNIARGDYVLGAD